VKDNGDAEQNYEQEKMFGNGHCFARKLHSSCFKSLLHLRRSRYTMLICVVDDVILQVIAKLFVFSFL